MASQIRTKEDIEQALQKSSGNRTQAAKLLGMRRGDLQRRIKAFKIDVPSPTEKQSAAAADKIDQRESDHALTIDYLGTKIKTPDELIEHCEIDMDVWEVDRIAINNWEVAGKAGQGQREDGKWNAEKLWKTPLRQIKVTLRRKSDERQALQCLLDDIRESRSLIIHPKRRGGAKTRKAKKAVRRRFALEIAIMDPHMGLECYTPEADHAWNLDLCEQFYLFAVEELIQQAQAIGDIEEIHWVFGNDFLHADNVQSTTTKGTPQPDNTNQHRAILRGKQLAISAAELMLQHAPVKAYQVPGNHDQMTSYMMGLLLDAYFHSHSDFEIDCSSDPFKKIRYGASLIGLEHGRLIPAIRLAALMANEWRWDWAETHYREFHCGDQHRKATSKPSVFEEQGVSIEYLAALVAPNEYHRWKSFNFQKRAATGFLLDYDCGPTHRLTVNISQYTGMWMGTRYDEWLEKHKSKRLAI